MHRKPRFPVHLREWREWRGLTLRELAARMVDEDGRQIISYASLGRIERGLQPYSQPILEALAEALDTMPGVMIDQHPAELDPIIKRWSQLDPARRAQAAAFFVPLLDILLGQGRAPASLPPSPKKPHKSS